MVAAEFYRELLSQHSRYLSETRIPLSCDCYMNAIKVGIPLNDSTTTVLNETLNSRSVGGLFKIGLRGFVRYTGAKI